MSLSLNTTSSKMISLAEFGKIRMVIANVIEAKENAKAKVPAYLISLNVGTSLIQEHKDLYQKTVYTSSAQLRSNHKVEDLTNHQLLCVANFPRKQIGPNMSDCLVTGVQKTGLDPDAKRLTTVFMKPTQPVEPGALVSLQGECEVLQKNPRDLSWEEFEKADLRIGTVLYCDVLKTSECALELLLQIDFGDEKTVPSFARVGLDFPISKVKGTQVLGLKNLNSDELKDVFGAEIEAVVCSVGGRAFLEPAKPVENGFKLA